jgi:hypothetical protein
VNPNISEGRRARRRTSLLRGGIGASAIAAVLATAAVGSAAPIQPASANQHGAQAAAAHKTPYFKTTMHVSPGTVAPGGRVTVSGDAGTPLHAGTTITLLSYAFASRGHVDGAPAIRTQVFANGTYSANARIQSGLRHTLYAIDASANGSRVGPQVWLHVRRAHKALPDSTLSVHPGTVNPGQRVTLTGDAPRNARAGAWLTFLSFAFSSRHTVNGVPAIRTQVFADGTYRVSATIRNGLKATNYAIDGMYNGRTLDPVAWLHVRAEKALPDSTLSVHPGTVKPGQRVTLTGDAPRNARAGAWLTFLSFAFSSRHTVNGVPAIRTQVFADGTYRVSATIRKGLKATNYAIDGMYNGRTLDPVAWLHVR